MGKIIEFQSTKDKETEEKVNRLRKQLYAVALEAFPIIEELNKLDGLELVLIDKEGLWFQNNPAMAAQYKDRHKNEIEKVEKED